MLIKEKLLRWVQLARCFSDWVYHVFLDGGTLLKHPSAAMTKLINSVKEDKTSIQMPNQDKALTRPVMAFIIQRHDLDGLTLAMRQALRKATCRVFALQVSDAAFY